MTIFNLKRRLTDQTGFILPTAVIVLLILTVLIGAAITVAAQTSTSTTRDDNSKAELEAAEAGLQVADYRLGQLKPEPAECITGTAKAIPESSGYCQGSSEESLGNGAQFQYWTSKALTSGKCAGATIVEVKSVTQRCITSEGIVNGVKPGTRLQTRIESAVGESLFAIKGIVGLEEVLVSGSVTATSIVASNDKITSGGKGSAAFEKGFELCPGGTFTPAAGTERNASGVTVGGKKEDPELEKTRTAGCPIEEKIPAAHATAASNEDERIISGLDERTENTKGAVEFSGYPTYELKLKSSGTLTLKGSKYYFCNVEITHSSKLIIAAGAKVEIFVDSHNCPPGSGKFLIEGAAHLENPNGASALLIEVAGAGPVTIANSGSLKANIFAPEGEVDMSGSGTLTGAIVGKKVHLEAGSFNFSEEDPTLITGATNSSGYSRGTWEQCTPGSGASEGC